jgi:hypothetical protein
MLNHISVVTNNFLCDAFIDMEKETHPHHNQDILKVVYLSEKIHRLVAFYKSRVYIWKWVIDVSLSN